MILLFGHEVLIYRIPLQGYMFSNPIDIKIENNIQKLYSKEHVYKDFSDFISDMKTFLQTENYLSDKYSEQYLKNPFYYKNFSEIFVGDSSYEQIILNLTRYLIYNDIELFLLRV